MNEIKYYPTSKRILVKSGMCYNFKYYILNLGTHPTAYVELPVTNYYYSKSIEDIDIEVHGGITYSCSYLYLPKVKLTNSWFIGWDYANLGDFMGYYGWSYPTHIFRNRGKKWTSEEIMQDVINVCQQLYIKGGK